MVPVFVAEVRKLMLELVKYTVWKKKKSTQVWCLPAILADKRSEVSVTLCFKYSLCHFTLMEYGQ